MLRKALSYLSLGVSAVLLLVCLAGIPLDFPAHVGNGVKILFCVLSLTLGGLSIATLREK